MKYIFAIAGVILVLLAPYLVSLEQGLEPAFLYLGGSLCVCALACTIHPPLERLVAEREKFYYRQRAERFIARQQELIKNAADEAVRNNESKRING